MEYEFSKESLKKLKKLEPKIIELIKNKIKTVASWLNNIDMPLQTDIKKLKGVWEGFYRLRIGKIRILFTIDDKNEKLRIHDIGFRGDIYK